MLPPEKDERDETSPDEETSEEQEPDVRKEDRPEDLGAPETPEEAGRPEDEEVRTPHDPEQSAAEPAPETGPTSAEPFHEAGRREPDEADVTGGEDAGTARDEAGTADADGLGASGRWVTDHDEAAGRGASDGTANAGVAGHAPGRPEADAHGSARRDAAASRGEDEVEQRATDARGDGEPVDAPRPMPSEPRRERSGGGFWAALLAAVIGGLIGAGGIWYYLQAQEPAGLPPQVTAALEQQTGDIAAQSERLSAIEGDIGSLNEALSGSEVSNAIEQLRMDVESRFADVTEALGSMQERIDSLGGQLDQSTERLSTIEARLEEDAARIAELEARPIADPETANQVLRTEVAEMRAEVQQAIEEARAQVETMRSDLSAAAEETQAQILAAEERAAEIEAQAQQRLESAEAEAAARARAAEAQAALAQIEVALDSGEPFAAELGTLRENAEAPVPDALAAAAESGVPTIAELRESFPDAARAALRATAVATAEGDPAGRVMAFLRTQTQARSLSPQEGESPDAILSRTEATLRDGNVPAALAELEALPEDGRAAMQEWIDAAELRAGAVESARSLSQEMN